MTRKLFFTTMLFVLVFALSACSGDGSNEVSDGSKEVTGAWKSVEKNRLSGEPSILLIDGKKVSTGTRSFDATFAKKDGKILISTSDGQKSRVLFVVTIIDKDTAEFRMPSWGTSITAVRATPEEFHRIAGTPSE